ncbi:MAG: hypothetical protein JSR46_06685 [Verrucomicrobia bacterium]|nr:hypothetical protein [Verrucomicrobiota bacterium]
MILDIMNTSVSEEEVAHKPLPTPPKMKKPLPVPKKAASTHPQTDVVAQTTDQISQKTIQEIRQEKLSQLHSLVSSDAPMPRPQPKEKSSFFSFGKKEKLPHLTYGHAYTQGDKVRINGKSGDLVFMS